MRPLKEFAFEDRRAVRYVLTDIDDTITTGGMLPSASLAAMERLRAAGIRVIPVTGRPAGWCDHIARMWPVDAVVGENGALWFSYDREKRHMRSGFVKTPEEREKDRQRLDGLAKDILAAIPGAAIASDQFCRIADLAIDFCEDVAPLPRSDIDRIIAMFERAGAQAKASSIHVNGWFGDYDKLSMTRRCLREVFDEDLDSINPLCVYSGDSPNDQPMFKFFHNSMGVANVRDYTLDHSPRWVSEARSAAGFAELADALLEGR
ncbi:MAG TPA: HAD-IIB family hydrolase [Rhodobacteraceae bacterium]|nr:HAD-IIB family hydrolase [Paracoccaceae bacterium]